MSFDEAAVAGPGERHRDGVARAARVEVGHDHGRDGVRAEGRLVGDVVDAGRRPAGLARRHDCVTGAEGVRSGAEGGGEGLGGGEEGEREDDGKDCPPFRQDCERRTHQEKHGAGPAPRPHPK